ncbi:MAG: hypothetical protein WC595_02255 [Candidatus Nanoarchaeia archaeon]
MLVELISLLGLIIGVIIARSAKEEFLSGKKYFMLFRAILLLALIGVVLSNFSIIPFLVGLLVGCIVRKEYLYFGLLNPSSAVSSLIFIYGFPYGTLKYDRKFSILLDIILFSIGLLINFITNLSYSFIAGGLTSVLLIFLLKSKHVSHHWDGIKKRRSVSQSSKPVKKSR